MKRHPFFAQIPADALRYLCGQVHVLHTQRGEYVVRKGQVANSMFFVVEGQFLAQRPADDPKAEDVHLTHQAFFGAQCIFRESLRTRNVIAITNGELLEVSTSEIYAVGEVHLEVGDALRLRLREAATCPETCAYCGFAHKLEECPELRDSRKDSSAEDSAVSMKSKVGSFKDAVLRRSWTKDASPASARRLDRSVSDAPNGRTAKNSRLSLS